MNRFMAAVLALLLALAVLPAQAAGNEWREYRENGVTYRYEYLHDGTIRLIQGCSADSGVSRVNIPNTIESHYVTRIGSYAFDGCRASEITIPGNVSVIEAFAFNSCRAIRLITIPSTVYFIDGNPFTACDNLVSIRLERPLGQDHPTLEVTMDGVLYNKGNRMLLCYPCSKRDESFSVKPGTFAIGQNAFFGCSTLKTITLPETVTEIGTGAFAGCSALTRIDLSSSILSIGELAFAGCASLETVTLPPQLTHVETSTFNGCEALDEVILSENLTEIGDLAFYGCKSLQVIRLPDHVHSIGKSAFGGCDAMATINLPVTVTSIGDSAFSREAIRLMVFVERYSYAEIYAKIYNLNYTYGTNDDFLKYSHDLP